MHIPRKSDTNHPFKPLLTKISSDFIRSSVYNAQSSLQNALSEAGVALGVDKVCLLRLIPSSGKLISLAQWVKKADYLDHTHLEGFAIDLDRFPFWKTYLTIPRPLVVNIPEDMGRDAENEKAHMQAEKILSLVAYPIFRGERPIGCIVAHCVERERHWQEPELDFAEKLAGLFSDFLERVEHEADMVINHSDDCDEEPDDARIRDLYLMQSQLISKAGLDLMHMHSKSQVLEFAARSVQNLFPRSLVSVSEYDAQSNVVTTRHLRGLDQRLRRIINLMGIQLEGKSYHLHPGQQPFHIMKRSLFYQMEGGLHEATLGAIGPTKAKILESICNVKSVYGAGFMANGKLYGAVVLVLRERIPVLEGLMESFIRMVSMSLYRIEAQQELIQSRSYLQNTLSAMTEGVVEMDLQGNVSFANASVFEFTGYQPSELLGKPVHQFLCKGNSLQVLLANTIVGMPGGRRSFELEIQSKSGQVLQVIANTVMVRDHEGNPRGFLGVLTDMSKLREKETELKDLQVQQLLLDYKQQFLSNMSHEMLTPFNGIIGVAQLLKKTIADPKGQELVNIISDSATQLLRVVKSLWEAHGLKQGALGLQEKEFDLCEFLHQNVNLFGAAAREKDATLAIHCQHSVNYRIKADELRIAQVLTNLIGNAVKFLQTGGRVDIKCDLVFQPDQSQWLRLEVQDNGPGIAPDKQKKIFELLEQADNSNTRQNDGLGLGLHLCSELIELMKGRKGFESELNKGSRFWFEVPVKVMDKENVSCTYHCLKSSYKNVGFTPTQSICD